MTKTITMLAVLVALLAGDAVAQGTPIFIRGLRYTNISQGTQLTPRTVRPGGTIRVTLPRSFGRFLRAEVILEDPGRGSGFGVTNFSLRRRSLRGNVMTATAPAQAVFLNRTFHVAVFVFENGVSRYYASAGNVRISNTVPPRSGGRTTPGRPPVNTRPPVRRPPVRPVNPPRGGNRRPIRIPFPPNRGPGVRTPVRRPPIVVPPKRPVAPIKRRIVRWYGKNWEDHSRDTLVRYASAKRGANLVIRNHSMRLSRRHSIDVTFQDDRNPVPMKRLPFSVSRGTAINGGLYFTVPNRPDLAGRSFKVIVTVRENGRARYFADAGYLKIH